MQQAQWLKFIVALKLKEKLELYLNIKTSYDKFHFHSFICRLEVPPASYRSDVGTLGAQAPNKTFNPQQNHSQTRCQKVKNPYFFLNLFLISFLFHSSPKKSKTLRE